ncbi:nucleoside 2-deoxyribosyltransferase [Enterococcus casseliflavus]|uniref:nucleoside 2-deoxyribosyltransferase n=1 Tax=Enterococcus casseliflavus TaxID=37734 RepID=UPI0039A59B97
MKHVYLAGPFFSNEQVARRKQVERSLAENRQALAVYSPRLYQEGSSEPNTPERAREIFEKDMLELTRADVVVAVLDDHEGIADPGTAFEIGAAHIRNKPVIAFQEKVAAVNLMLKESVQAYLTDLAARTAYDFEEMAHRAFVGDYI